MLTTLHMTAAEPSNFCLVLHSNLLVSNYGYSELLPHLCISCMYFELARYDMQHTYHILQAWIGPALKTGGKQPGHRRSSVCCFVEVELMVVRISIPAVATQILLSSP